MRNTGLVECLEWTIYDPRPDELGGQTAGMYLILCGADKSQTAGNVVCATRDL